MLDVPPRCLPSLLDPTVPLLFTEGAKKADCAAGLGYCAINIWGTAAWYRNPEHRGFATIQAIPDWQSILETLDGRICYLAYDSDAWRNPSVAFELRRLANWLARQGALVYIVHLPDEPDGSKNGLDDFVTRHGAEAFHQLVADAEPWLWGVANQVRAAFTENRQLKKERTAIFGALRNPKLSATERIAGVFTVFGVAERLAHPDAIEADTETARITVDVHDSNHCTVSHCDPKDPRDPCRLDHEHDPARRCPVRAGFAHDIGLSPSTVHRVHDVLFSKQAAPGAPLHKDTVDTVDDLGRKVGAHVVFKPTCSDSGVPGQLWALARYDPKKQKQQRRSATDDANDHQRRYPNL